jgi:hypothetical protein
MMTTRETRPVRVEVEIDAGGEPVRVRVSLRVVSASALRRPLPAVVETTGELIELRGAA